MRVRHVLRAMIFAAFAFATVLFLRSRGEGAEQFALASLPRDVVYLDPLIAGNRGYYAFTSNTATDGLAYCNIPAGKAFFVTDIRIRQSSDSESATWRIDTEDKLPDLSLGTDGYNSIAKESYKTPVPLGDARNRDDSFLFYGTLGYAEAEILICGILVP